VYTPRCAYVERGFTRDLRLIKARVLINLPPGGPEGGGKRYQHFEEIFGTLGATFFQSYIYTPRFAYLHPGSHIYTQVRIHTPSSHIHTQVHRYTPRGAYIHPGSHIYTQVRLHPGVHIYTHPGSHIYTQGCKYTPRGRNNTTTNFQQRHRQHTQHNNDNNFISQRAKF